MKRLNWIVGVACLGLAGCVDGGHSNDPDGSPPTFAGIIEATPTSPTSIELRWVPADDFAGLNVDRTADADLEYRVYWSTTRGGQQFSASPQLALTGVGERLNIPLLQPATTYFFVVHVRDLAGNVASNAVERSGTTPPAAATAWHSVGGLATARAGHSVTTLGDGRVLVAGGVGASALTSAELFDGSRGFTSTGVLGTARRNHSATLLRSGRILVVGGDAGGSVHASAEVFDPTTGSWTPTGSLLTARTGHTATLLRDGQVLIVGGDTSGSGGATTAAEIYDPVSGSFTSVGNLTAARIGHSAILMGGGQVFVAGGRDGAGVHAATTELFDPSSRLFTAGPGLGSARSEHVAELLADGTVLLAGGLDAAGSLASAERFDSTTGVIQATGALTTPRRRARVRMLASGHVVVVGGATSSGASATVDRYDPRSGQFVAIASLGVARWDADLALLPGGRLLIVGGSGPLASAEMMVTTRAAFAREPSLSAARSDHIAAVIPVYDSPMLIAGGRVNGVPAASAELHWPRTELVATTGAMNTARAEHVATVLPDGRVLVVGGRDASETPLASAEYYWGPSAWIPSLPSPNPRERFQFTSPMQTARARCQATPLVNGRVLVTGGETGSPGSATRFVEIFDPGTNAFGATGQMTTARASHTATLLADGRVLITGGIGSGAPLQSAEIYDPVTGICSATGSMANARRWHTATRLPSGKVLICGGVLGSPFPAELYDPVTAQFTPTGAAQVAHDQASAVMLASGNVLVTSSGGWAEEYDSVAGVFSMAGPMTQGRAAAAVVVPRSGSVRLFGGSVGTAAVPTVEGMDAGIGARTDWTPRLFSVGSQDLTFSSSEVQVLGGQVRIRGIRFQGIDETLTWPANMVFNSVWAIRDSPSRRMTAPVVVLRGLTAGGAKGGGSNATFVRLRVLRWTNASIDADMPAAGSIPPGHYTLTIIANGVASEGWHVRVQ